MGIRLGVYMCVWSHRSVCSGTLTSTITTHFSLSQPKRKTHWPRCRLQVNMGYVDSSYVLLFEIGPKMNLAPWRRQSTGTLKYLFPRLHNRLLTKTFYFIFWSCRMTVPTVSVPGNHTSKPLSLTQNDHSSLALSAKNGYVGPERVIPKTYLEFMRLWTSSFLTDHSDCHPLWHWQNE